MGMSFTLKRRTFIDKNTNSHKQKKAEKTTKKHLMINKTQ
jgi:hypothetical protein